MYGFGLFVAREQRVFASEQRATCTANKLHVKLHARDKSDEAAGINVEFLPYAKFALYHRASRMQKHHAVTIEALQDEAINTK